MELSGSILILSKDILSSDVVEKLQEHLPEFKIISKEPKYLSTEDLDKAVITVANSESFKILIGKFEDLSRFPPTLMMTDESDISIKSRMEDFVYDTFSSEDPPEVIYRRIRNALFYAIKSKDQKAPEGDYKEEKTSQIHKVLKASKSLILLRDTEASITRIITSAASIINCEGGMIFLVDKENQIFTGFSLKLSGKSELDSFQEFDLKEGIPGWVHENKDLHICNDPSFDSLFSNEFDKRFSVKSDNVIAYPLLANGVVLGVLRLYNKKSGEKFTEGDGLLLKEISDIASQILQNTHYFENHSNFFTQAIKLLIIALEAHDEYFKLHSDNVTTYVDRMAEALELSLDDSLALHFAAIFHDIGKLRIDSKILTKEAPLSQIEKKRLSLHSIAGEELLKGIKIFNNSTKLIRHHHEWYNGTGFPDGLTGVNIPYGSRIIHICEAYDSMTSLYLPHRIPLDIEEACREMRTYAGAQFDSELVEIFIGRVLNK